MAVQPRQILQPFDFLGNEIRQAVIHVLAAAPASPKTGQFYFDSVKLKLGQWNGTTWNYYAISGSIVDADIAAGAAIQLSKLAVDPLARANHTGTQLAATISDFNTAVRANRLDQLAVPTVALSMGGQKITNLADGAATTDAATWGQVQTIVNGLRRSSVRLATTGALPAHTATSSRLNLAVALVVDGVTPVAGDRILVKDEPTQAQNGVYVVTNITGTAAQLDRAPDADTAGEMDGMLLLVEDGNTLAGTAWSTTSEVGTLGTDPVTWSQWNKPTDVTAGAGLKWNATNPLQLDVDITTGAGLVAGTGLASDVLALKTDNSTINEFQGAGGDSLGVKPFGIGAGQIASAAVSRSKLDTATQRNVPHGVDAAAVTNINTTAPASATFDGVTLVAGQRVGVVAQTTPSQNGVWIFNGAGTPMTRAIDFPAGGTFYAGEMIAVAAGTTAGGMVLVVSVGSGATSGLIGSDNQNWMVVAYGSGTTYATGDLSGSLRSGPSIAPNAVTPGKALPPGDPSLAGANGSVAPGAAGLARTVKAVITGDGTTVAFAVPHLLGTRQVVVSIQSADPGNSSLPGAQEEVSWIPTDTNTISVEWPAGMAPSPSKRHWVTVIG